MESGTHVPGNISISSSTVSNDSTLVTSTLHYYKPFNEVDIIVVAFILIALMVFGLIANGITVAVIATTRNLHNIFNYFIMSLCVSDAISASISWINLYRRTWGFDNFLLSEFMCDFYWAVDVSTSYVTSLHIVNFALLRLIGIARPTSLKGISLRCGKIWILLIWLIGILCGGVPMGIFSGITKRNRLSGNAYDKWPTCAQNPAWLDSYHIYTIVAYTTFLYIPIICTLVISCIIARVMIRKGNKMKGHISTASTEIRRKKEQQALFQLTLIIISFLLGYLPFTAFEFYSFTYITTSEAALRADWQFGTAQYICMRISECLDPIFYNLGSTNMRQATVSFCKKRFCCKKKNTPDISTSSGSGSHNLTKPVPDRSPYISKRSVF